MKMDACALIKIYYDDKTNKAQLDNLMHNKDEKMLYLMELNVTPKDKIPTCEKQDLDQNDVL